MKYLIAEVNDTYCPDTDRHTGRTTTPRPDLGEFETAEAAFLGCDQANREVGLDVEISYIVIDETGAQAIPELPPMEVLHGMEGLEDFEV